MANVGKLVPHEKGFRGRVATMAFAADLVLSLNPRFDSREENSPRYVVQAKIGAELVEIGAAWQRTIQRGEHQGEDMLSITVDDPSLDKALNLAAFLRDGGTYDVTWSRPRVEGSAFKPDAGRAVA